jgi:hypothetical protein
LSLFLRLEAMRPGLGSVILALAIAGCGPGATPWVKASAPTPATTFIPVSQPFQLFTHCGIMTTQFAGRTFYLAELYPARVSFAGSLGNGLVSGRMTLLSPHVARFSDPAGNQILFVDQLPGALNITYPFAVHVLSGGNSLIDEQFAGRHWHTTETLPGVKGPPYGNGMDSFTEVPGTLTIVDAEDAVFRSDAGEVVHFTALGFVGCD